MITRITENLLGITGSFSGPLWQLLITICYIIGLILFAYSLLKIAEKAKGNDNISFAKISAGLLVALFLMYLPAAIQVSNETLFTSSSLLAYENSALSSLSSNSGYLDSLAPIFYGIQFFGVVAIANGLWGIYAATSQPSGAAGLYRHAFVKILSGTFMANIYQTITALVDTVT